MIYIVYRIGIYIFLFIIITASNVIALLFGGGTMKEYEQADEHEQDVYSNLDDLADNDELSAFEVGFMSGYNEA